MDSSSFPSCMYRTPTSICSMLSSTSSLVRFSDVKPFTCTAACVRGGRHEASIMSGQCQPASQQTGRTADMAGGGGARTRHE